MKYVAWHNGHMLDDTILDNIIHAAKRGKITEAGRNLMLVPDKRTGDADVSGFKVFGRVKKSECIPLKSLARI